MSRHAIIRQPEPIGALARFAITEAAADARKALPEDHPARLADALPWADPDARDEAIARAWFHQCGGTSQQEIDQLVAEWKT